MTVGVLPSRQLGAGILTAAIDVVGVCRELTQPTDRRLVEPGPLDHDFDREALVQQAFGSGRRGDLRVHDRSLSRGPRLPGDLNVDGRLVDALLPGQLLGVETEPALPGGQRALSRTENHL